MTHEPPRFDLGGRHLKEAGWLAARHVAPMLQFLETKHPASGRKLQLFSVACCRRIQKWVWECLFDLVDFAEQFAEGTISEKRLARSVGSRGGLRRVLEPRQQGQAANDAAIAVSGYRHDQTTAAQHEIAARTADFAANAKDPLDRPAERVFQASLLRHIVGNPFIVLTPFTPSRSVIELATAVYEGNTTSIGPLHDALLDAGHDAFAEHFHDPGEEHPKGCWALDVILGKS